MNISVSIQMKDTFARCKHETQHCLHPSCNKSSEKFPVILHNVLDKVHKTQMELVKCGLKSLDDIRFAEAYLKWQGDVAQ